MSAQCAVFLHPLFPRLSGHPGCEGYPDSLAGLDCMIHCPTHKEHQTATQRLNVNLLRRAFPVCARRLPQAEHASIPLLPAG